MQIYIVYVLTVLNCTSVFSAQMVLSLFALKLGGNEFQVGLLSATFAIFPMLLAVSAGRLVDRYGGLWPLVFGTVCGGLGLLIPFVFPFPRRSSAPTNHISIPDAASIFCRHDANI